MESTAPGWAIRRKGDSCLLSSEVDCGATANGFRACCPSSTTCPQQYNVACCPANTNCTATIADTPSCANSSWIMFDNGGYFCCESGQVGYNLGNTDGCSGSGKALPSNANPLAVVSQMFLGTSTSSTSTSTSTSTSPSTATTSPSETTSPDTSNPTPGGTIAGAVVGTVAGVAIIAGLIWFFIRKKKSARASGVSQLAQGYEAHGRRHEGYQYKGYYEMKPTTPSEVSGTPKATELPVPIDRTEGRSEMP